MKTLKMAGLSVIAALFALPVLAAEPLVDTGWVKASLGKPGIVFLDVTSNPGAYARGHIPGAVYTHYKKDNWRVDGKNNGHKVAGVLPPIADLEKLIGRLGIGNGDHVVIVANGSGAAEMGTATRLYWTFKVLGHDEVSILNGGMQAWLKDKSNPLEAAVAKPAPTTFKANFRPELIATSEEVNAAVKDNGIKLIDARPADQFLGLNKSGAVRAYGTIPGSYSVPGAYMTVNGGGEIRDKSAMRKLYAMQSAPSDGKAITFCNTGHWASLGWFVQYEILGNKDTAMYDGSMAEYTTQNNAPMERKAVLE